MAAAAKTTIPTVVPRRPLFSLRAETPLQISNHIIAKVAIDSIRRKVVARHTSSETRITMDDSSMVTRAVAPVTIQIIIKVGAATATKTAIIIIIATIIIETIIIIIIAVGMGEELPVRARITVVVGTQAAVEAEARAVATTRIGVAIIDQTIVSTAIHRR